VPLSKAAQEILAALPIIGDGKLVFTHDGYRYIGGFSQFKEKLDKASGVTGWRLHDLRRTARSLMSRAGVDADIAERCLGHVMGCGAFTIGTHTLRKSVTLLRRWPHRLSASSNRKRTSCHCGHGHDRSGIIPGSD
jgi:integrase